MLIKKQITDIEGRKYPAEPAGRLYPKGIPVFSEDDLGRLIQTNKRILPVSYDLEEIGSPDLHEVLKDF